MEKEKFVLDIDELKKNDKIYLKELQIFFDKVSCIKDEELREQILQQMHICEQRIILMCEESLNRVKKL